MTELSPTAQVRAAQNVPAKCYVINNRTGPAEARALNMSRDLLNLDGKVRPMDNPYCSYMPTDRPPPNQPAVRTAAIPMDNPYCSGELTRPCSRGRPGRRGVLGRRDPVHREARPADGLRGVGRPRSVSL